MSAVPQAGEHRLRLAAGSAQGHRGPARQDLLTLPGAGAPSRTSQQRGTILEWLVGISRTNSGSAWRPLLPPIPKMGRPPRDRRQVFDGIWWRARTGSPWRDIPERYGPWETAYSVFRRWQIDGAWTRVLEKLQVKADADGVIEWEVSVDSTVCRAHQHAADARKKVRTILAGRARTTWQRSRTTMLWAARAGA
ncbi:hypothetical protein CG747_38285 [Streptomyces sp. CB02959]|nr:hypothetical protein CG747_38285 [Streptomyces sp. CB02959]